MDFSIPSSLQRLKSRHSENVAGSSSGTSLPAARWHPHRSPAALPLSTALPARDRSCQARPGDALVRLTVEGGVEHTLSSSLCGCVCVYVGVPPPPLFRCFFFLLEAGLFVLLILLECGSYRHPEEFITLWPSALPRPGRLRNKRAIVGELPPEFRCAGAQFRCSRLFL